MYYTTKVSDTSEYTQMLNETSVQHPGTMGDSPHAGFIQQLAYYFQNSYNNIRTQRNTKAPTTFTTAAYIYLNVG
jgi:hypothetical protein